MCAVTFSLGAAPVQLISSRNPAVALPIGANGDSVAPAMTPDGRFVLFESTANNLVTNGGGHYAVNLFLRDRTANATVLISVNLNGVGGNGPSTSGQVSTNGRYVVFQSSASDLLAGDTNDASDIFVRDTLTGSNILVSVAIDGGFGNGQSTDPVMTPDGRFVVFCSDATNLVANDTNGFTDVFVRDLVNNTTTLVSADAPIQPRNFFVSTPILPSRTPAVTPDGRYIAFLGVLQSTASGLPGYQPFGGVFIRDTVMGTTTWASSNAVPVAGFVTTSSTGYFSYHPEISDDGRFVSFKTSSFNGLGSAAVLRFDSSSNSLSLISTNAAPLAYSDDVYGPEMTADGRFIAFVTGRAQTNQLPFTSVFLADTQAGTNIPISVCPDGTLSTNSTSDTPVITADGRFVAFLSNATNLVANAVSNGFHIYLRDLQNGVTTLIDADTNGAASVNEYGNVPSLSADGNFVAFASADGPLVAQDNNRAEDVFVRNVAVGTNEWLSLREPTAIPSTGTGVTLLSRSGLTPDGRFLVFASGAEDLVGNDHNGSQDVFRTDLLGGTTVLVSEGLDGNSALGGYSGAPVVSSNGQFVAFYSTSTNLVAGANPGFGDIYWRDMIAGTNALVSLAADGVSAGNGNSWAPVMSQDGRYIAFLSSAANLPGASPNSSNTFWRDMVSGTTLALTTNVTSACPPAISADGRYVAYFFPNKIAVRDMQASSNLYLGSISALPTAVALSPDATHLMYLSSRMVTVVDLIGKTNLFTFNLSATVHAFGQWSADSRYFTVVSNAQVYLGDVVAGTVALVSASPDHSHPGNGSSDTPVLSGNGRYLVYRSFASNIAPGIVTVPNLFLYSRDSGSNTLLNPAADGVDWSTWVSNPTLDNAGRTLVFQSSQSGLATGDINRFSDIFATQPDVTLDSDGDGIPDWWMNKYFGHPTGLASDNSRAQDDANGTGLTNLQKFLLGLNPIDPSSTFQLGMASDATGQNVMLSWPGVPGKSYQIQYKTNLTDADWLNYGGAVVATSSGLLTVPAGAPSAYYRVIAIE